MVNIVLLHKRTWGHCEAYNRNPGFLSTIYDDNETDLVSP